MGSSGLAIATFQIAWVVIFLGRANDLFSYTERAKLEIQDGNYTITPIQLGGEVRGINLKGYVPPEVIKKIRRDVHRYGLLVFKDQGVIPADRHAEITEWFGPLKITFKSHFAQTHPEVFRVSNEDEVGNGKSISLGWHIDGALPRTIISHSIFHILAISNTADTWFTSLYDLVERMSPNMCERYERLYMLPKQGEKLEKKPVIYTHPVTNRRVMLLYSGAMRSFIYDWGSPTQKSTNQRVARSIVGEMTKMIESKNHTHVYKHKWQLGDFIVVDNQAVAHKAPPESSWPPEKVGLRLLHRASADSLQEAEKKYDPNKICFPDADEE